MTTVEARRYTPEDLLRLEDGGHYELVDGQLVERNVSTDSSAVAVRIIFQLFGFLQGQPDGEVYDSELGVRAFPGDPNTVHRADVAFVRAAHVPVRPTDYLEVMPDLVVEVVSLGDNAREVRNKVDVWLDGGVRMVWVVSPDVREVTVYRGGIRPVVLTAEDEIDGQDVVPGFSCPVARFFPEPAPAAPPPVQT